MKHERIGLAQEPFSTAGPADRYPWLPRRSRLVRCLNSDPLCPASVSLCDSAASRTELCTVAKFEVSRWILKKHTLPVGRSFVTCRSSLGLVFDRNSSNARRRQSNLPFATRYGSTSSSVSQSGALLFPAFLHAARFFTSKLRQDWPRREACRSEQQLTRKGRVLDELLQVPHLLTVGQAISYAGTVSSSLFM